MNFASIGARAVACVLCGFAIAQPQPGAAADMNKTLRVAQSDIDTLAPQEWTDYYTNWVGVAIFEGLYEWDYLARPARLFPNTAAALPDISADGLTWTVRIKPGIYFTDDPAFGGKPRELVAQDYVFAFKRMLDPNLRHGGSLLLTQTLAGARAAVDAARKTGAKFDYDAPIEGLRALDRHTIQFRLNQPNYPVMEQNLTIVLAVAREVVDAAGRDIGMRPVGTGPYRLKEWKRGSRIILEANPNYRAIKFPQSDDPAHAALVQSMQGKRLPQIGVVHISVMDEMYPRLLEFEQGRLDYIELQGEIANRLLNDGKLKPQYAARGVRHYPLPQTYARYTYFNMDDPIVGGFSKEHVSLRRAIALAFDADELIRVAYAGQAITLGQIIGPGVSGHDPGLPRKMPYDPAAARALLDRAGYDKRDRDGFRLTPEGGPLTVTILTRTGTLWREWETLWKKNLEAIGIRVTFRELSMQEQFKELQSGHFQMGIKGWGGSPLGYVQLAQLQASQTGNVNPSRFALNAYDRLYDQLLRTPDREQQQVLARQMSHLAAMYAPFIPHVVELNNDFVHPWVQGFNAIDTPSYFKYLDIDLGRQRKQQPGMSPADR